MKDKVIVITGSGGSIGSGVAKIMAELGAKVVVNDLRSVDVNRVTDDIKTLGGDAIGVVADITKKTEVEAMFMQINEKFGHIDVLLNNAGFTKDVGFLKMAEEEWDNVINVNLKGTFLCSQIAASYMRGQKFGRIINISSRAWLGWRGQANYSASKGGVVSLTRSLALELARYGITVNCIAPGTIKTSRFDTLPLDVQESRLKMQPMGILGSYNDIARTVSFFANERASYITGQTIYVCGGKSLFATNSYFKKIIN